METFLKTLATLAGLLVPVIAYYLNSRFRLVYSADKIDKMSDAISKLTTEGELRLAKTLEIERFKLSQP